MRFRLMNVDGLHATLQPNYVNLVWLRLAVSKDWLTCAADARNPLPLKNVNPTRQDLG